MSIENEIASLTQSTTGLLTAVNTKKAILDTAVTNAEAAATDSTAQAVTSTSAKNSSEAARDAAVVAKNAANTSALNAASVVTGGTATVAPAAGKIPLADSEGKIDVDWLSSASTAMSKADFFALAEKRKADSAGSGFSEWGKHFANSNYPNINEGMWAYTTKVNKFVMGEGQYLTNNAGVSRTPNPTLLVNGAVHSMEYVAVNDRRNEILFPDAPDGTKTYDSATGSVVTHASPAEAFEGVVTNGDFRNNATGWSLNNAVTTIGSATIDSTAGEQSQLGQNSVTIVGTSYTYSLHVSNLTGNITLRGNAGSDQFAVITTNGLYTITRTATDTGFYIQRDAGVTHADIKTM